MPATDVIDRPSPPADRPPFDVGRILLILMAAVAAVIVMAIVALVAFVAFGRSSSTTEATGGFEVVGEVSTTDLEQASEAPPTAEPSSTSSVAASTPTTTTASTIQGTVASTELGADADDAENSAAAPTPTGLQPLTLRGMGSIAFGMTVSEAEAALGTTLEFGPAASDGCFSGTDPTDVNSPLFMVLSSTGDPADGSITRIDLGEIHSTRAGIGIGSTKAQVLAAYGDRIVASPHPDDSSPGSEYLSYVPADRADSQYRLIFETQADQVIGIRAGLLPSVEWIEGCA